MKRGIFLFCLVVLQLFSIAQEKHPWLWEIQPKSGPPSYLFGSIHLPDSTIYPDHPEFWKAFNSTSAFAAEIIPDQEAYQAFFYKCRMDPIKLSSLYTLEEFKFLESRFKEKTGKSLQLFENMIPISLYYLLAENIWASQEQMVLDDYLFKKAEEAEKELKSLETLKEHLKVIDLYPIEEQARDFYSLMVEIDSFEQALFLMRDYYLAEDFEKFEEMGKEKESQALEPKFEKALISDRNEQMTRRLIAIIRKKSVFAVVGSGHLHGPGGMIERLKAKGFTLRPLPVFNKR